MALIEYKSVPINCWHALAIDIDCLEKHLLSQETHGNVSLAELLLDDNSTAIYHLGPQNQIVAEGNILYRPLLLAANLHGHSEGKHTVIVQDVGNKVGPYVLFAPPGSNEATFHLQHLVFPHVKDAKPEFMEDVPNPLKIRNTYYFTGEPNWIFEDFKNKGYNFANEPISKERLAELRRMTY